MHVVHSEKIGIIYKETCVKIIENSQCVALQCENLCVCKWKDRRDVYTTSNMHRVVMVPTSNQKGYKKMKPNTVQDYNRYMSGIHHTDQMLSYNTILSKSLHWHKRVECI